MHYEEILQLKEELRSLRYSLDLLRNLAPTPDRMEQVHEIEKKAKDITRYIRARAKQYGFAA